MRILIVTPYAPVRIRPFEFIRHLSKRHEITVACIAKPARFPPDLEKLRKYCLRKKGVSESFPFNDYTLVFKVLDKIFCLADLRIPQRINLKCDPEKGLEYREEHDEIIPGYHMNKKHWNTIDLHGKLEDAFITEMIDDSYELVVNSLSKKEQNSLKS